MIVVYLGALLAALGAVGVQLVAGHDTDASGDVGADAGGDVDVSGDVGGDHDFHAGHDVAPWSFLASLRFWSFALLAFGLIGTLSSLLHLAGATVTFVTAAVCGLAAGWTAVTVVRRLTHRGPTSHVRGADVVGRVGRVIVPPNEAGRATVRIEVKGSSVDWVARSSEALEEGEAVLVDACENGEVSVTRAPKELKP